MSLTKRSEHYARHMDELFHEDRRDYDLEYREQQYLEARKQTEEKPKQPKQDERFEDDRKQ